MRVHRMYDAFTTVDVVDCDFFVTGDLWEHPATRSLKVLYDMVLYAQYTVLWSRNFRKIPIFGVLMFRLRTAQSETK